MTDKVDYLSIDTEVPGQNFVCLSPENVFLCIFKVIIIYNIISL